MEGYSKEAFDANEKKIDEVRPLAGQKTFGGRGDPTDILDAKWKYLAGKEERKRLIDQAHDEAIKENESRTEKPKSKIGNFSNLRLETESGNVYIIQKNTSGDRFLVANFNTGFIDEIDVSEIADIPIVIGKSLSLGKLGQTSAIKAGRGK